MSDKRYWIWLQQTLGQGACFKEIINEFGSVENLYNSNVIDWKMSPSITQKQIDSLSKIDLTESEKIITECEKYGYGILTYDDERYPDKLRNIKNPPAVLYIDGEIPDFDLYAVISVVGTRKASTYAVNAARLMSKGMAQCGAVIVSGAALGVDAAAHTGAIEGGAKTYAVLGNGFGADYLKANEPLRNAIKNGGGALITEYPPKTSASKYNFPMRNRIISALADGILVIEAGEKSGSLITASHAAEQGKDIFAIPASIFDKNFQGTNKLIDDGAFVATSPETVLSHYSERYPSIDLSKAETPYELLKKKGNSANTKAEKQVTFDKIMEDRAERVNIQNEALKLTDDEKAVYNLLSDDFKTVGELTENSNITVSDAFSTLTILEMKGVVESAAGQRYRLK